MVLPRPAYSAGSDRNHGLSSSLMIKTRGVGTTTSSLPFASNIEWRMRLLLLQRNQHQGQGNEFAHQQGERNYVTNDNNDLKAH
jgi:hypothetical protein